MVRAHSKLLNYHQKHFWAVSIATSVQEVKPKGLQVENSPKYAEMSIYLRQVTPHQTNRGCRKRYESQEL